MFTQLFGNFLLRKGVITAEQLVQAMKNESGSHVKLGTLCIHAGYMTAAEVEKVNILQLQEDKRFGEIAVEEGYITQSQMEDLLTKQNPSYLLLAQELIEKNILTHEELEQLLYEYQSETELYDLDIMEDHKDRLKKLVTNFCNYADIRDTDLMISYLQLLFNNLIRFIGDDFTPMNLVPFQEYVTNYGSSQKIEGAYKISSAIDMDANTAIAFASRFTGEKLVAYNAYVSASMDDFLNMHNGLFIMNISNSENVELNLNPPVSIVNDFYSVEGTTYLLPITYTFGTINFLLTV